MRRTDALRREALARHTRAACETVAQPRIRRDAADRVGERDGVTRRHEQPVVARCDRLGQAPDRRRDDGNARDQRLHHADRQALVVRGQDEAVRGRDETRRVVAVPEQPEVVAEAQRRMPCPHVGLERPLPRGDEPHREPSVANQARRLQEPVVILLRAEIRHRHRQYLTVGDPELAAHHVAIVGDGEDPGPIDAVDHHLDPVPQSWRDRRPHVLRHRDGGVVEPVRRPVRDPGGRPVRGPPVVLGVHEGGTSRSRTHMGNRARERGNRRRVDVHHVVATPAHEVVEPREPPRVEHAADVEAVRGHTVTARVRVRGGPSTGGGTRRRTRSRRRGAPPRARPATARSLRDRDPW